MAEPSPSRAPLPRTPHRAPATPGSASPGPAPDPAAKPPPDRAADPSADLALQIAALRAEVARLNAHRFVRDLNSPVRMLAFQFARGLALGLGTVVGASILVSLSVYLLSQVDFIPILGDWAAEIAREIEAGR
jgi:hypothetical protein